MENTGIYWIFFPPSLRATILFFLTHSLQIFLFFFFLVCFSLLDTFEKGYRQKREGDNQHFNIFCCILKGFS